MRDLKGPGLSIQYYFHIPVWALGQVFPALGQAILPGIPTAHVPAHLCAESALWRGECVISSVITNSPESGLVRDLWPMGYTDLGSCCNSLLSSPIAILPGSQASNALAGLCTEASQRQQRRPLLTAAVWGERFSDPSKACMVWDPGFHR